jgi:hypothetical protein
MLGLYLGSLLDLVVEGMAYIMIAAAVCLALYSALLVALLRYATLGVAFLLWSFGLWTLGISTGAEGADARCEKRIQLSIASAAERDREAQILIDDLNRTHEANAKRMAEEIFRKDREYENERAAEEDVDKAKPKACSRRASSADDRRVFGK